MPMASTASSPSDNRHGHPHHPDHVHAHDRIMEHEARPEDIQIMSSVGIGILTTRSARRPAGWLAHS